MQTHEPEGPQSKRWGGKNVLMRSVATTTVKFAAGRLAANSNKEVNSLSALFARPKPPLPTNAVLAVGALLWRPGPRPRALRCGFVVILV